MGFDVSVDFCSNETDESFDVNVLNGFSFFPCSIPSHLFILPGVIETLG